MEPDKDQKCHATSECNSSFLYFISSSANQATSYLQFPNCYSDVADGILSIFQVKAFALSQIQHTLQSPELFF